MTNRDEFKIMAMLYAANIDGNVKAEEVNTIIEKVDAASFKSVYKMFSKMNDAEVLEYINKNKSEYISTEADLKSLLEDCHAIISADEENTVMEEYMIKALERTLR